MGFARYLIVIICGIIYLQNKIIMLITDEHNQFNQKA